MLHFTKKKKRYVAVYGGDRILYKGLLEEIPLKEEKILNYSIRFFQDPEPCYIHRGAVRLRLVEEMAAELVKKSLTGEECPGFVSCAELKEIDRIEWWME